MTLIKLSINWKDQVKFDQLTKKSFDQTPNLTESFDQLKMSSEIWSSDHSPYFQLIYMGHRHALNSNFKKLYI